MTESTQMFLANLDSMARHIEELRQIDSGQLDAILQEHAWAEDHIATSKDDLQEVTEFMLSYTSNQVTNSYAPDARMNHRGNTEFSLTSRNESRIYSYETWSTNLKK